MPPPAAIASPLIATERGEHRNVTTSATSQASTMRPMVTPVASVGISILAFAARRDWLYVAISAFVFAMLMLGFAIGSA